VHAQDGPHRLAHGCRSALRARGASFARPVTKKEPYARFKAAPAHF
jgi:hypothetical protein